MIFALRPRERFYKKGFYLPQGEEIQNKVLIKFKTMSEMKKSFSYAVSNLIVSRTSFVIIVNKILDYKIGDKVYTNSIDTDNEEKEWMIRNCFRIDDENQEQALRYTKLTLGTYWVLELE